MKKYLFIKLRAIGDTVILSSSINALKDKESQAEIDILIPSHSLFAFESSAQVRKIFTLSSSSKWLLFFEFILKLFNLRKTNYDFILNFHASHLSAFVTKFAKGKTKVVYNQGIKKRNLFSELPIPGKGDIKSIIEKDYDVLRAVGVSVEKAYKTQIFLSKDSLYIPQDSIGKTDKKIIGIHPGASKATKKWGISNYVALLNLLDKEYEILFLYSKFEEEEVREIQSSLNEKNKAKFIKTKTLRELCAYLKKVNLFLGMDSGPKHIAVALDVPTITLFSSESMGEFHPYKSVKHIALRAEVPCRPNYSDKPGFEWCGLSTCASMQCMEKLTPELVTNEINSFLKKRAQYED